MVQVKTYLNVFESKVSTVRTTNDPKVTKYDVQKYLIQSCKRIKTFGVILWDDDPCLTEGDLFVIKKGTLFETAYLKGCWE